MDIIATKRKLDIIFSFICNYYGIPEEEVRKRSRLRKLVMIRHRFYWLARKHFYNEMSLTAVGSHLGYDHATVLHGCDVVKSLLASDKLFKKDLEELNYIFERDIKRRINTVRIQEIPKNEYQKIKKQKNDSDKKVNEMYYIAKRYLHDFRDEINQDLILEGFRRERLNRMVEQKLKDLNNVKMRYS